MTRTWFLSTSAAAFMAGLTLMHCSSSSSTGTTPPADGGHSSSSTKTTTSSTSSAMSSATSQVSSAMTGASSGTSGSSGSSASVKQLNYAAGDAPDACAPPTGGDKCTPGTVNCGGDAGPSCEISSGKQCCQIAGSPDTCQAAGATCSGGAIITCNEAADCTDNQICCLNVTSETGAGTVGCQEGPTCSKGEGIAYTQICRSNAECTTGKCGFYKCTATTPPTVLEACVTDAGIGGLLGTTCTLQ
jgi:hypothetical protein